MAHRVGDCFDAVVESPLEGLAAAIVEGSGPVLVCTGAGVSLASGVPTFRGADPGAVWAQEVIERGTRAHFETDPASSWAFYLQRFEVLKGKRPNPAHQALSTLEQWLRRRARDFLLVTQNIDLLHEAAGSTAVVKVHGSSDRARCSRRRCELGAPRGTLPLAQVDFSAFRERPCEQTVPRCPRCGALLRPHILWFDERYDEHADYDVARVIRASKRAGLVIFVGTSFSVGVTAMLLERAVQRGPTFSVDPSGTRPHRRVEVLAQPSEVALPALLALLEERSKELEP